jgi:hypothetical protein
MPAITRLARNGVAGNEKKYIRIVHQGQLKEWCGIGWVRLRNATARDKGLWPNVVDKLPEEVKPC